MALRWVPGRGSVAKDLVETEKVSKSTIRGLVEKISPPLRLETAVGQ